MNETDPNQHLVRGEPYYRAVHNEVEMYEAAYAARMPVMLKGPTGCGKSRFVEYMAWMRVSPKNWFRWRNARVTSRGTDSMRVCPLDYWCMRDN
jgi:transcriptional regulator with AAA-type ATPase domain